MKDYLLSGESVLQCFNSEPRKPLMVLPPGACDTHVHVVGPRSRFPFVENRPFTPADASKEALFELHRVLGFERCVVVQSGIHGFDNSAVEEAIATSDGSWVGVALVEPTIADAELARLAGAGFRAVRFTFSSSHAQAQPDEVIDLSHRLARYGMHVQIQADGTLLSELSRVLMQSAVPVVIDHMGRVNAALGVDQAPMAALRSLLQNEKFYVKISGIDRITIGGNYADGIQIARALAEEFGDRCLWGSDWPHLGNDHVPDDAELVELLESISPNESDRSRILVENPARLFRFEG
ncbi:amidohydrolase family protein [Paraburkholderia fynbosensis]|uniref:2-pyrone-4,6-dicarbaxylate hydrolase n=1 Tax=Paraburkholderia fynbosensis TaxID=1200993 RepID=A0A6J5GXZ5_9BURK|nr:amidohydrolase family protein [Paraburkholderia fynbosensis]CAB3806934.1 2-pyrone-4,6-dicarbaxylate hydrolase [Paraburkholderia fynbosensis]